MVDYIMQFYRNSWYNIFDWIFILMKESELMLYPYMTLSDETQIMHSLEENGLQYVEVQYEKIKVCLF